MKTEKFSLIVILIGVGILIALAFAATFVPAIKMFKPDGTEYPMLVPFFGINLTLLVVGTLFLTFCLIRQYVIYITHAYKHINRKEEYENNQILQKRLKTEAEERRDFERERNQINDMFRLFELAKEKPEEIADKTKTKENGETPKHVANDIITKKNEFVNTDKLANLINEYQSFITAQQKIT